jgi:DNA-binding response OmpR family regulator
MDVVAVHTAQQIEAVFDLVAKGFAVIVLPVRLERPGNDRQAFSIGPMTIDIDAHTVSVDGGDIALTKTQFRLLVELARQEGRVRTFDELVEAVWGYPSLGDYAALRAMICRIRKLLRSRDLPVDIKSVRGVGFQLASPNV